MGDSIVEGTLATWEKAVGETVAADEVVATIETDKVAVDVRAEAAGVIVERYAEVRRRCHLPHKTDSVSQVDDTVQVGADLLK